MKWLFQPMIGQNSACCQMTQSLQIGGVGHPDKQFLLAEDCLSLYHDNIGQISGPDDVRDCYCCIPVPVLFMGPIVLG